MLAIQLAIKLLDETPLNDTLIVVCDDGFFFFFQCVCLMLCAGACIWVLLFLFFFQYIPAFIYTWPLRLIINFSKTYILLPAPNANKFTYITTWHTPIKVYLSQRDKEREKIIREIVYFAYLYVIATKVIRQVVISFYRWR